MDYIPRTQIERILCDILDELRKINATNQVKEEKVVRRKKEVKADVPKND